MLDTILEEFAAQSPRLKARANELHARLETLLAEAAIPVHFVTARVKDAESLARKLARPEKSYRRLHDVTDLVGLRVATFFDDDVERVARVIEARLAVDFRHSADQARPAGYRSMHYVCSLPGDPDPDFRYEIQVRTVLQHAWAEIEHDLGYKVNDAMPEAIRHRFARVAGLLEIADQEFVSIRDELAASRDSARALLAGRGGDLPVDLVSLEALTRQPAVEALDQAIAKALGKDLSRAAFFPGYLVQVLRLAGLATARQVEEAVARFGPALPPVLAPYFDFAREGLGFDADHLAAVERGYGLLFIAHLAVIRGPDLGLSKVARLTRLYQELEFQGDPAAAHRVASALVASLA